MRSMRDMARTGVDRFADERGVFIPALMGAGILTSMALLLADGLRRVLPVDGARAREARAQAAADGRVGDLTAAAEGLPPQAPAVPHVPRKRREAAVLGVIVAVAAAATARWTLVAYNATEGVLAQRGWTMTFGLTTAAVLGAMALAWLVSAAVDARRPAWMGRMMSLPLVGTFPAPRGDDEESRR